MTANNYSQNNVLPLVLFLREKKNILACYSAALLFPISAKTFRLHAFKKWCLWVSLIWYRQKPFKSRNVLTSYTIISRFGVKGNYKRSWKPHGNSYPGPDWCFYASTLATVVAGGIMFLGCQSVCTYVHPFHSREHELSGPPWGNILKFGRNVYLGSRMNCLDFGGQRSMSLQPHVCPVLIIAMFQEYLEGISFLFFHHKHRT